MLIYPENVSSKKLGTKKQVKRKYGQIPFILLPKKATELRAPVPQFTIDTPRPTLQSQQTLYPQQRTVGNISFHKLRTGHPLDITDISGFKECQAWKLMRILALYCGDYYMN